MSAQACRTSHTKAEGCFASVLQPLAQAPVFSSVFRERGICSACWMGSGRTRLAKWVAGLELENLPLWYPLVIWQRAIV